MITEDYIVFKQMVGSGHKILAEDFVFLGVFVPKGFITDGASIPFWAWSIIRETPYGRVLPAAIIHDYLYQSGDLPRHIADFLFYHALIKCRIPKWKAKIMHYAVRWFGRRYYQYE